MITGNNDNPISDTPHVSDRLSEYIDGLLAGDAHEAVRQHIESCTDCRADYIELRATQKLVGSMPVLSTPRAFTLTPEMAGQVHKTSFWERFLSSANSPRLATGSVVAFLLLFVILSGNIMTRPNNQTFSKNAPGLVGGSSDSYSAQEAAPSSKQESTEIAMAAPTPVTGLLSTPAAPSGAAGTGADTTTTGEAAAPSAAIQPPDPLTTPNTNISNSGTGSPTTTTMSDAAPPADGLAGSQPVAPDQRSGSTSPEAQTAGDNNSTLWTLAQISLLALGLALGVAAFIARRNV